MGETVVPLKVDSQSNVVWGRGCQDLPPKEQLVSIGQLR